MTGRSGEEALLYWCQKQTKNYYPFVNIVDFGKSFQDGLAFCALLHNYQPQWIDFKAQTELEDPKKTLELSFDLAEKYLNIPKSLNANDLLGTSVIDERIVMTYVSNFWKLMSPISRNRKDKKKVSNFHFCIYKILSISTISIFASRYETLKTFHTLNDSSK